VKGSGKRSSRRKPEARAQEKPTKKAPKTTLDRYKSVLVASQEARRITAMRGKDAGESAEKPVVRALKRLADEELKIEVSEEE
jgi:DNA-directed RNA polymerase subunit K/omega